MLDKSDLIRRRGLPRELHDMSELVKSRARDCGLDFWSIIFELVDSETLNEVAAYGGFPTRYPHWRFGMSHQELTKGYAYGLSKIYELVINNDPCYAYLMRQNALFEQKLVMAHVCGHADFFKHNMWFAPTNRRMVDTMANHGSKVRSFAERHGAETVEAFIDRCLCLDNLIDTHAPYRQSKAKGERDNEPPRPAPGKLPSPGYMDRYVNPPELLAAQRRQLESATPARSAWPDEPERDILGFLIEHAPLEPWQRDVLSFVRDEALYFAPQAMTKIMNEGWASYWHSELMTKGLLDDAELIDYADRHAGTMASSPTQLNPYKLGIELFRDIEERWNQGRFGPDWELCDDHAQRAGWDKQLGLGRAKIFEVRKVYNDVTFIDEFLTQEFCERQRLFVFAQGNRGLDRVIASRAFEEIKRTLLDTLTNSGQPVIEVNNANHDNRGELYLVHRHAEKDLQVHAALDTLGHLHALWGRAVHLETQVEGQAKLLSFEGGKGQEHDLS